MDTLLAPLSEINAYGKAMKCIGDDNLPVHISGCIETQKCHFIYGLSQKIPWRVIIAQNELRAKEIAQDYRMFDKSVLYYPPKDIIFYSADICGNATSIERLKVIKSLLTEKSGTVVTTIDAGMESASALDLFSRALRTLRAGDVLDVEQFAKHLSYIGYERQYQVERPGEFSIRGGIIDVFPVTEECPYRIEMWDDEVDTVRSFDVESQRSIENVDYVDIFPASELMATEGELAAGIKNIDKDYEILHAAFIKSGSIDSLNRLKTKVDDIKESLQMHHGSIDAESLIGYFNMRSESMFDYFDEKNTLFFIDEPAHCVEKLEAVEAEFRDGMEGRLQRGEVLPGQADAIYSASKVLALLEKKRCVYIAASDILPKSFKPKESLSVAVQPIGSYNRRFNLLVEDIKKWRGAGFRILLLSGSRVRARRLADDLNEYGIPAFYREEPDVKLEPKQTLVSYGQLRRGFLYTLQKFAVITESDIFGAADLKRRGKRKRYDGKSIRSFDELSVGDYVIHEEHGLGVYCGIEKIRVDNVTKDYVKIEYGDGGNLYVPASGVDVLQKYADKDAAKTPKLNKLGSAEWKKTKSRVKSAVNEIAEELVRLYARRLERRGYMFGADTVWQKEFEDMFPYEETKDQLDAIEATKKDMESSKIMDRLICGDVGYGKTEIAIRAAFKAANDGKQVAFLVPTTILAQQHYNTLRERIGDFPIKVEMLSRFRTSAEQAKIVKMLKKGQVDIVVGTHRLLSNDVGFKDLGLLIIDEEQHFGVAHKEKIKHLKNDVDVLTLSATPIPRTLHMSLSGIRDMSVLEEPPMDRTPIQTFVMEHNDEIIREAINRELARGGQVFYVYNSVEHIEEMAAQVAGLVTDARVSFAHGRMNERQLEGIMLSFINGQIDVLVATTIIETGLDIANVNTMIIDNADRMGLSQLYQLRGRVGRSNRTAYAFLMYKRDKMLKEDAEKRLAAIREFTDLGSGIKVAMRDLEIRGAGNLLGSEQSGHMEAVGYDLYCKMLNDAVKKLKGERVFEEKFETSVDLSVDAFISSAYIKSEFQKLDIYKRIAGIEDDEEYSDMEEELLDRFGEPPAATRNLLRIALLKVNAHKNFILQISQDDDGINFYLLKNAPFNVSKISAMMDKHQGRLRYVQGKEPYFKYMLGGNVESASGGRYAAQRAFAPKNQKKLGADDVFGIVDGVIKSIGELYEKD